MLKEGLPKGHIRIQNTSTRACRMRCLELMLLKCSIKFLRLCRRVRERMHAPAAEDSASLGERQKQCVAKVVEAKHDVRHKHQSLGKLAVLFGPFACDWDACLAVRLILLESRVESKLSIGFSPHREHSHVFTTSPLSSATRWCSRFLILDK